MLRQGNWGLKCEASQDRALKLYPVRGKKVFTWVFLFSSSFTMGSPFLGSSICIRSSSIGSKELLVAGCCALVLFVVLLFDSCLSSSGLICCYTMSSSFVDFSSFSCPPFGCLPMGWLTFILSLALQLLW